MERHDTVTPDDVAELLALRARADEGARHFHRHARVRGWLAAADAVFLLANVVMYRLHGEWISVAVALICLVATFESWRAATHALYWRDFARNTVRQIDATIIHEGEQ